MINYFVENIALKDCAFWGTVTAFLLTCILLAVAGKFLPRDQGREFAHDGAKSAGKPRGAGFIFVIAFVVASAIFAPLKNEIIIYLILLVAAMMTGFLDDCAKTPWGEYKKAIFDLIIAVMVAWTYLNYNGNEITLSITNDVVVIPTWLFVILAVILVWVSINVTNCADGVDGLSGTLTIISLMTFFGVYMLLDISKDFGVILLIFVVCILGYLWFNATPSHLMMGDAGSRAMGLFIAIAALKSGRPLLYIPVAIVLILDGGLGLVKVFLKRFLKISILKNTRTPLHDHVRKVKDWSNTQAVFRFAIIQIMISVIVIYMIW
ncbi:MAG: phospho-N-acetylmuramoyl-pentapeptide-transferase [Lachnospiraceae bacterium]|nr:phospho-N-acetylmuramoyl-pentapeptide-transferase [Lachnospiraceae bacterium]